MFITDVFDDDLWTILARLLRVQDTGAVACTCRAWRRIVSLPSIDRCIAQSYAIHILGDAAFWRNTCLRPVATRRPLATFRLEIKRIEEFKRVGGRQRLAACELYELWRILDGLDPSAPRRLTCRRKTPALR